MKSDFNKFLELVITSQNQQEISQEGREYLYEVWQELQQNVLKFYAPKERENLLYSEVQIDQIFYIDNEQYCKESKSQYFHIISQIRQNVFGDPVVQV